MADDARIAAKVFARNLATESHEVLRLETSEFSDEQQDAYWARMYQLIGRTLPKPRPESPKQARPEPMTDAEAKQFGRRKMPWGKFCGLQVGEAPIDYLLWLDEQRGFCYELRRYILSDYAQRLQPDPADDP